MMRVTYLALFALFALGGCASSESLPLRWDGLDASRLGPATPAKSPPTPAEVVK